MKKQKVKKIIFEPDTMLRKRKRDQSNLQDEDNPFLEKIILEGNSLFIFSPNNIIRQLTAKLLKNIYFEYLVIAFILLSTIMLAIKTPLDDPSSNFVKKLDLIDLITTIFFLFELSIKVITLGFIFNGKNSYLRDVGNCLG